MWSVVPIGRDPHLDELRIRFAKSFMVQTHLVQQGRWAGIQYNIRTADQIEERRPTLLGRKIQLDRSLVAVIRRKAQAARSFRPIFGEGTDSAGFASSGWFDPYHIGAQVSQHHATQLTSNVSEIKHPIGVEQAHLPGFETDKSSPSASSSVIRCIRASAARQREARPAGNA